MKTFFLSRYMVFAVAFALTAGFSEFALADRPGGHSGGGRPSFSGQRGDSNRGSFSRGSGRGNRGRSYYSYGSRYPRYRAYGHRRYYGDYWGYPYSYGWGPWWQPGLGVTIVGGYGDGDYYGDDDTYSARVYRGRAVNSDYGSSVESAVQRKLSKLGYYSGPIDGDIGPASRRAIRRYQQENDMDVTGRIDRDLIASLDVA